MKELQLKLVSELLKNNRRSDRELAKASGVSQPTISRMIKKLEEEGVIKEHTIIPDLRKMGIELLAITLGAWSPEKIKNYSKETRVEKARKFLSEHPNVIFASSGQGLGMGRMIVTVHKNYSDYTEFMRQARTEWAGEVKLESYIISLETDIATFPFTLRNLGKYLKKMS